MTTVNDEPRAEDSRRRRRPLHRFLLDALGDGWCGGGAPPCSHRSMYVYDDGVHRVFSTMDDGGFVGIGYPDEWHVTMRTRAARMFALWMLRNWVADWFGLRSAIWYRALHRAVKGKWALRPYPSCRCHTRRSSHAEWDAEVSPQKTEG